MVDSFVWELGAPRRHQTGSSSGGLHLCLSCCCLVSPVFCQRLGVLLGKRFVQALSTGQLLHRRKRPSRPVPRELHDKVDDQQGIVGLRVRAGVHEAAGPVRQMRQTEVQERDWRQCLHGLSPTGGEYRQLKHSYCFDKANGSPVYHRGWSDEAFGLCLVRDWLFL